MSIKPWGHAPVIVHACGIIVLCVVLAETMQGADIYISQSGTGNGTTCSSPQGVAFFNSASNWGATTGQIGPGTTVHLCGTFTGTAGSSMLQFHGSGTSTQPITLLFESGALLTAPYWAGNPTGAIDLESNSYIIVDGGTNGTIRNTDNGTTLTYQTASTAIECGNCSQVQIRNLNIINMFQRSGSSPEPDSFDPPSNTAINLGSSSSAVVIKYNIIHDGGWAITNGGDYIYVYGNNIYNYEHDVAFAPVHAYVFSNYFHDWALWDTGTIDAYHHDGIHCFAGTSAGNTEELYVYNNWFSGQTGQNMNQYIFTEAGASGTACFVSGATSYICNNVFVGSSSYRFPAVGGPIGNSSSNRNINDIYVNNTVISTFDPSDTPWLLEIQYADNVSVENNAVGGSGWLVTDNNNSSYAVFDHNAYEYCTGFNCFSAAGQDTASFSSWQSATGFDTHSLANLTSPTYFNLDSSARPNTGSPLIGAGANLYSVCHGQPNPGLGALCFTFDGVARPATGAWNIGAY